MQQINNSAVKRFYDEFRDAEMNKEYYAERMHALRSKVKWMNIFLALFAGSSAILSFSFWSTTIWGIPVGSISIGALTGIAIVLSIAKPYFGFENDIERVSSVQGVYSILAALHKDTVQSIIENRSISNVDETSFGIMKKIRISVDPKEDKPSNKKLIDKIQYTVNTRYPRNFFWYPEK